MDKKLRIPQLLALFCLCLTHQGIAQFTLSAEVRPRAEYRDGFKTLLPKGTDAAFFIEQRTRLNATFVSEKFDTYISLQDVRTWGAVTQVYKSDPSLQNIYQAWARYKFNVKHSVTVGRMELDYDNVRILGNLDWASQGRSHDLVRYEYKDGGITFHAGIAFNQDANTPEPAKLRGTYYGVPGNYKTMQYAWIHRDWDKSGLSLLLLNNGIQSPADSSVNFSQTMGFYGTRNLGNTGLEYDAYYQLGKNPAGTNIGAYMFGINATFRKTKPHTLTIGFDYLSGDKANTTDTFEAFNPLYGTHHKFYGFMDYFFVGNGHKDKGLVDLFAKAKFKTGEKSTLVLHAHQFLSQSRITNESNEDLSSSLATEIDVVYAVNLAPGVALNAGYSRLFQTESMEYLKGVANPKAAHWAWVMIGFKPTLFTTKTEN